MNKQKPPQISPKILGSRTHLIPHPNPYRPPASTFPIPDPVRTYDFMGQLPSQWVNIGQSCRLGPRTGHIRPSVPQSTISRTGRTKPAHGYAYVQFPHHIYMTRDIHNMVRLCRHARHHTRYSPLQAYQVPCSMCRTLPVIVACLRQAMTRYLHMYEHGNESIDR